MIDYFEPATAVSNDSCKRIRKRKRRTNYRNSCTSVFIKNLNQHRKMLGSAVTSPKKKAFLVFLNYIFQTQ